MKDIFKPLLEDQRVTWDGGAALAGGPGRMADSCSLTQQTGPEWCGYRRFLGCGQTGLASSHLGVFHLLPIRGPCPHQTSDRAEASDSKVRRRRPRAGLGTLLSSLQWEPGRAAWDIHSDIILLSPGLRGGLDLTFIKFKEWVPSPPPRYLPPPLVPGSLPLRPHSQAISSVPKASFLIQPSGAPVKTL